jgi:hypothetical protein
MEEDEQCTAEIWMYAIGNSLGKRRQDFTNICEARSWLKNNIQALVDLYEQGTIVGFDTMLSVRKDNMLKMLKEQDDATKV